MLPPFSLRVLALGLLACASLRSQTYTWTHLAGRPPLYGVVDGTGVSARFNQPTGVATDAAGNVYVSDGLAYTIRKISPAGAVTTLAGSATEAGSADGSGRSARFNGANGLAVDRAGNLFVADRFNHTIRRITPDGVVSTFAGQAGVSGSADGAAATARFYEPAGLVFDPAGNLFVADRINSTIRRITSDGTVSTVAGAALAFGSTDGPGAAARFRGPFGIAIDAAGVLYVADSSNHTIRKIATDGTVSTLAGSPGISGTASGTGSAARFNLPYGIAVDPAGNLYVADYGNDCLRRITPGGTVSTYAGRVNVQGSRDGIRTDARFFQPAHIAFGPGGDLFIADLLNHSIRKLDASENVTLFAGPGGNFGRQDGTGAAALFNYPNGIAVDASDFVIIADCRGNTVRRISPDGVVVTIAGGDTAGYADGERGVAVLNYPFGIAVAPDGTVFFCEQQVHTIRRISPTGTVSTLAGTSGTAGAVDGDGTAARFDFPSGIARDAAGNLYISDSSNHAIRRIAAGTTNVTTFAGLLGGAGSADGTGNAARFRNPVGLRMDNNGDLLVADTGNHTLRRITPAGVVTTIAGSAGSSGSADGPVAAARFSGPYGIAVDRNGAMFVTDAGNSTIRRIAGGSVTTIGGMPGVPNYADGRGSSARFFGPSDIAVDSKGTLYVVEWGNNIVVKGVADSVGGGASGRLTNLSVLTDIASAGESFTLGYVVGGAGTTGGKNLLIRAAGPSLVQLGVPGVLADPKLELFAGSGRTGGNDNWGGTTTLTAAFASVGAFAYSSGTSLDAAVVASVNAGDNSVVVSANDSGTGAVIAEVYDTTAPGAVTATTPRLINVSVLKHLGTGLTAGFTLGGTAPTRVLVRAIGPTLGAAPFGVPGVVADPQLKVYSGQTAIASNDNWAGTAELSAAFAAVGAFSLPAASRDAAVVFTLDPGSYTVQVTGVNGTTGTALVEVYEVR